MKYIKTRKDLIFAINPLFVLAGIFLFCFLPRAICSAFYAFWITTAFALFLIVTPFGNQRLSSHTGTTTPRLPWQQWYFCIVILELTLLGVYCGISFVSSQALPIDGSIQPHLFSRSLQTELLQYGLFPWTFYALIAVGMGVLAYCQETNAYFSNFFTPWLKQKPLEIVSSIVNVGVRRCTLFAVSVMLMFMILLLMSFVLSPAIHLTTGFQPAALLTTLALFILSFTQTAKRYTTRLFSRRLSTALSFPIYCVAMAFIILLLSVLTIGLSQQTAAQPMPQLIASWIHYDQQTAWSLFSVTWWICLTPLVSGFLVRISKGYKIRDILMGVLILPIMISLFFIVSAHIDFEMFTVAPLTIKIIALISFLIVLPLLINRSNLPNAIESYFPKNGIIKMRDQQPFFLKISQLTVVSLYFYLVLGMNGISLFLFAPNYLAILVFLIICFAVVIKVGAIWKHKT